MVMTMAKDSSASANDSENCPAISSNSLKFSVESLLKKKETSPASSPVSVSSSSSLSSPNHHVSNSRFCASPGNSSTPSPSLCHPHHGSMDEDGTTMIPGPGMMPSSRIAAWTPDQLRYLPPFPFMGLDRMAWIRGNNPPLSPHSLSKWNLPALLPFSLCHNCSTTRTSGMFSLTELSLFSLSKLMCHICISVASHLRLSANGLCMTAREKCLPALQSNIYILSIYVFCALHAS